MSNTAVDIVLERLDRVKPAGPSKWRARCPAHEDRDPSLSVAYADGKVLLNCFAGCTPEAIVGAVGLTMADLFDDRSGRNGTPAKPPPAPAVPPADFAREAAAFRARITPAHVLDLAARLGVRPDTLDALGVGIAEARDLRRLSAWGNGWHQTPDEALTFPERDGDGNVVGLAVRAPDGAKGATGGKAGSKRGLIVPQTESEFTNPVLIVEGASDVAACLTLGLEAVGRPSCNSGGGDLARLLSGRDCVVVGENDQKEGSWPGRDGAKAIAAHLACAWGKPVRWALPPEGHKDIRAYLNVRAAEGLDIQDAEDAGRAGDELLRLLLASAKEELPTEPAKGGPLELGGIDPASGRVVLSKTKTLPTAGAFVRQFYTHADGPTLVCYAGVLMTWEGNRYGAAEDGAVGHRLFPWLHDALAFQWNRSRACFELVPFESNPRTVSAALESIKLFRHLPEGTRVPSWLAPGHADAASLLPCRSMTLHLPSLRVLAPTPLLFNTNALDFDYDPAAPAPALWLAFLGQLWPADPESIACLQEWFGYCLVADTSQQKMLLLIGPRRSGKGTLGRVLARLVGLLNQAGPNTSSLAGNFGLQPLIGKSLAIVSDARFHGEGIPIVVERLLCISGEDPITIDRKYLPSVTLTLPTRFMFLTNELPKLTDASSALAGRFIILRLVESFYGREDKALTEKLIQELPGILLWAIEGWKRLQARGRFVQPASSADIGQQLEDLGSPVGAFVRERCLVGPGKRVGLDDIYQAWCRWCQEEGRTLVPTKTGFGKDLGAAVPTVSCRRGTHSRFYEGIALKASW